MTKTKSPLVYTQPILLVLLFKYLQLMLLFVLSSFNLILSRLRAKEVRLKPGLILQLTTFSLKEV